MAGRVRKGKVAFTVIAWSALSALAFGYLRIMGWQPRTVLAWVLVVVVGPTITIMPYALAENLMERVGIRTTAGRPGEPARILDARRVLLAVIALSLTVLGLLALTGLATGPLATLLHPLAPLARRHFEAVR